MRASGVGVCVSLTLLLGGCASIIDGSSQEIAVNSNPAAADCALVREGAVIGRVNPTPGATVVKKTKHDIAVKCSKAGYQDATYLDHSGIEGSTWGNIVLGGGIGWAIDSASGSDNAYESPVNITLVPVGATEPPRPAQPAQ